MPDQPSHELTYQHPALIASTPQRRARASLVIEAHGTVQAVSLSEGPGLVIGRAAPADLSIDDKSLSRSHARFSLRRGLVHVEDLGSTNGVRLDGELVRDAMLEDGDSVALGAVRVTVSGLLPFDLPQQVRGFSAFREGGRAEIDRAHLLGRSFSLLAFRASDAAGVALARVPSLLRSIDLFSEDTPDLALVLLPETPVTLGLELGRRIVERIGEPLSCAAVAYPDDGSDLESLIEHAVHQARTLAPGQTERASVREPPRDTKAPVIAAPSMQRLYALVEPTRVQPPIAILRPWWQRARFAKT